MDYPSCIWASVLAILLIFNDTLYLAYCDYDTVIKMTELFEGRVLWLDSNFRLCPYHSPLHGQILIAFSLCLVFQHFSPMQYQGIWNAKVCTSQPSILGFDTFQASLRIWFRKLCVSCDHLFLFEFDLHLWPLSCNQFRSYDLLAPLILDPLGSFFASDNLDLARDIDSECNGWERRGLRFWGFEYIAVTVSSIRAYQRCQSLLKRGLST